MCLGFSLNSQGCPQIHKKHRAGRTAQGEREEQKPSEHPCSGSVTPPPVQREEGKEIPSAAGGEAERGSSPLGPSCRWESSAPPASQAAHTGGHEVLRVLNVGK